MNNNDGTNHPGDLLGALIFGALGLAFFLALSWALDNSPTMQDEPTEDSAGWECEQDGNGVCGPLIATAEDYGIVVEDATGTLGVVRWEMTDALAPEKAWDACITAADVVAEGDVPAGTSEVLTDLCSTMVGYID